eukprot:gnl/Dysnectes_brevis/5641_a8227_484.p1 GENE.gnl/Dysnectes_brevis/5641_a8227_484~~gnl/Dysnectes_brevis/5641_a8227_484.p1  ORF type:complete len:399 (+),score=36.22 gnl/Dysnectes_brevis/5641_a8227_484:2-1198(+)
MSIVVSQIVLFLLIEPLHMTCPSFLGIEFSLTESPDQVIKHLSEVLSIPVTLISTLPGYSNIVILISLENTKTDHSSKVTFFTKHVFRLCKPSKYTHFASELSILSVIPHDIGPRITAVFKNAILLEYIEGDLLEDDIDMFEISTMREIAKTQAKLHSLEIPASMMKMKDYSESSSYLHCQLLDRYSKHISVDSISALPKSIFEGVNLNQVIDDYKQSLLSQLTTHIGCLCTPVLLHNDLNCGNVIVSDLGVRFIDWEYAGIGHDLFGVAEFLLEGTGIDVSVDGYPNFQTRLDYYRSYLEHRQFKGDPKISTDDTSDSLLISIECIVSRFLPLALWFWGCWAWSQREKGDVYRQYGLRRLQLFVLLCRDTGVGSIDSNPDLFGDELDHYLGSLPITF